MEFKELMGVLAKEVGLENELTPDEDGIVSIAVSQTGSVMFMEIPQMRSMLMWSQVGELSELNADRLKNELLKANFMGRLAGGATMSLDDEGGIYIHRILPLEITDADVFMEALTALVEAAVNWNYLIAVNGSAPSDEQPSESPESEYEKDKLSTEEFIRV